MNASLPDTNRQRVAVLILAADRLLLIHRYNQGREYYVIPGGGVEPGETLEHAALREIKDETGLDFAADDGVARPGDQ